MATIGVHGTESGARITVDNFYAGPADYATHNFNTLRIVAGGDTVTFFFHSLEQIKGFQESVESALKVATREYYEKMAEEAAATHLAEIEQ